MDLAAQSSAVNTALTLELPDLAATHGLAARLAAVIRGGDLITLRGELGIGKSELARALIRAYAGSMLEVPSPTFTIVQDYALEGQLTIRHVDLYRIEDPDELFELGLEEQPSDAEAWLVEWPERAGGRLAPASLEITLEDGATAESRTAHLSHIPALTSRLGNLAP
ncbi:MAG: tRNA (adenosine(37)-N6)-threonylcarbamoyltransferase complex ATPase subunit type 1 TsaE [Geminicoccaceae bacterium]